MKNILYVTQREYLTRVRKKSFIIMTLLGPVLLAGFYGLIFWLAISDMGGKEVRLVQVVDRSGVFAEGIENSGTMHYIVESPAPAPAKDTLPPEEGYYGKLIIPEDFSIDAPSGARFISEKSLSIMDQESMENQLESTIKRMKLTRAGLRSETLDSLKTHVKVASSKISQDGELKSNDTMVNAGAGFIGAFLIYLFIFLYGVQVMKGVAEEKSNRIVEVIISSLKPFELMMGKILGVAAVGLTQVLIWVCLSGVLMFAITGVIGSQAVDPQMAQQAMEQSGRSVPPGIEQSGFLSALFQLDFTLLLGGFLFYFVTGYLLYSAMFAAIASAVDSETDTQQFMFPVTIPLIFSIVVAQTVVIKDPTGTLATWFSMIPLTSPIVMMVRLPFGVPGWQLLLSMIFMIFGFIAITWLAARIYRVGILMYGKKATWRELFKWMLYRG